MIRINIIPFGARALTREPPVFKAGSILEVDRVMFREKDLEAPRELGDRGDMSLGLPRFASEP